ncbi:MBL fold metallo-hydrolase [Vibrio japonicus]|uniref:MBL fold metallo-hydrolase n=1 Tax=Vibrio japonicus TaxID=1824638 RepID=A0ABY5LQ60_9VIBR|nr:MBL fold metallo-hydrolase [Vibrio japonicus]UUM32988.1 MBL fold metallo-hydrolase [Vibrio japonicus]
MSNGIKTSVATAMDFVGLNFLSDERTRSDLQNSEQERLDKIASSQQFKDGKAIARMPKVASPESMLSVMWKLVCGRNQLRPQTELPYVPVDTMRLEERSKELRVTWLGHSSLYIEMEKTRILIDPVFEYASPWIAKSWYDRNVSSPVSRDKLPTPDVIVISHDHYDHLEESTVRFFANSGVRFFVPLAVGRHLEKWGVDPKNIREFDWWDEVLFEGVRFVATPANHNSGRTGFDSNSTLWCSWALLCESGSLFYSGDTAYDRHFKQIADELGPFDMAFIEVAANVKDGKGFPVENWGHMQARHTVRAFNDLNAGKLCPIHWCTYELFSHQWDEPMLDLLSEVEGSDIDLVTPMVGQTFNVHSDGCHFHWWEETFTEQVLQTDELVSSVGRS